MPLAIVSNGRSQFLISGNRITQSHNKPITPIGAQNCVPSSSRSFIIVFVDNSLGMKGHTHTHTHTKGAQLR